MRLLVVAQDKVDASAVRSALPGEDLSGAEVLVVSPAVEPSGIKFWMSDVDDAIVDAEETASATADALKDEGTRARAQAGEAEPLLAMRDALATFPADRILVFGDEDLAREARDEFSGVQVDAV
jgi:hypothetical protein